MRPREKVIGAVIAVLTLAIIVASYALDEAILSSDLPNWIKIAIMQH